jgi:hypothetical protein
MHVLLAVLLIVRSSDFKVAGLDTDREPAAWNQELLDRTLAIVGGQPITLSDARAAVALGLLEADGAADPIPGVVLQMVDRELVLREVQRYAPAAPAESAVDARFDQIRARFTDAAALTRVLEVHGFTEGRLKTWIRDDLRTTAYLAQRFASASTPSDQELSAAYARARTEFDQQGLSFERAVPIVRDRLIAARRRELIADWVADLRRRTDVVILQQ